MHIWLRRPGLTYPKEALRRPPRVSPVRRAISSVAKPRRAARGIMATKLTTKIAILFISGRAPRTMPTGAAISNMLIHELNKVRWIWFPKVKGSLGWTFLNKRWSFFFFGSSAGPELGVSTGSFSSFTRLRICAPVSTAVKSEPGATVSPELSGLSRSGPARSAPPSLLVLASAPWLKAPYAPVGAVCECSIGEPVSTSSSSGRRRWASPSHV